MKNLPYFIKAAEAGKTEKFDNFKELAGTLGSFGATVASQHVKASKEYVDVAQYPLYHVDIYMLST